MVTWFKIALRNLIKNRRRTTITVLAISFGFAAVNLFGGFTTYMYNCNRDAAIYTSFQGHLNITKTGFWEEGKLDPSRYFLTANEIRAIQAICNQIPDIVVATPQLNMTGLVSNGRISTIFIARGIVPSSMDLFLKRTIWKDLIEIRKNKLNDENMHGVAMASGLARLLALKEGGNGTVVGATADGQINALDLEVSQLIEAANNQMNDKLIRAPLSFVQRLYDFEGADKIVVLLKETGATDKTRDRLIETFEKKNLKLEVQTWVERSQWYRKVKDMFDIIFFFLFAIVFTIVVMSIVNTMSMAVLERTREIGTLRALGLKHNGVMLLFALEAGLIGIGGSLGGIILGLVGWQGINLLNPTWSPPGMSHRIPLEIEFVPEFIILIFAVVMLLCIMASLLPARNAARQNIIDALGHV